MWRVENVECGKCGVWKMWSGENVECGKCGVQKMKSVENAERRNFLAFYDIMTHACKLKIKTR